MVFVVSLLSARRSSLGGTRSLLVERSVRRPRPGAWATWRLTVSGESFDFFLGNSERTADSMLPTDGSDLPEVSVFAYTSADTGSPEYQIAMLTERVNIITEHLRENPKDYASTRGLSLLNARRRRLLRYLQSVDLERFDRLVSALKLRVRREDTALSRRRDLTDEAHLIAFVCCYHRMVATREDYGYLVSVAGMAFTLN
ncbi:hypothetical protein F1559_002898 [Cyanidiococcus yangmingshanensis]|uniref:30S ribosomal protein S15 n=1 Tax=Cyanidiococcus yangmingshanensis TaxID=2690220 RepID=A0A7J7II39_9RHOD|nr:hypothetical protein F1559_002898 [Cyanidiococcus yangmingshanensis]